MRDDPVVPSASRFSSVTLPAGGPRRSWHASTFDPPWRGERTGGMRLLVSRRWSKRHGRCLARSRLRRTGAAGQPVSFQDGPTRSSASLSPRSASTARPSEELSLERCVDVARWPRPVSTLRSERVSSFALKSRIVGRIQLRPARSTVQSPVTYECVCEATVRRRRRQASPSLPPPTKLPVWLSCAAPPPARWLVFVVVVGAEERARIPKPRRIRENVFATARPRSYLQSSLLCTT